MPDILSPEARALIDAYPSERIRRVPTGVTGQATYAWDGDKLVASAPSGWREKITAEFTARKRNPFQERQRIETARKRRDIAILAASGLTPRQIGERLKLSVNTVRAHLRKGTAT